MCVWLCVRVQILMILKFYVHGKATPVGDYVSDHGPLKFIFYVWAEFMISN